MVGERHRPNEFQDRAAAAFLGLALGDAFGRPLEFVQNVSVRTTPVAIREGEFRWTDDTHMALYLAKAVLELPATALDEDVFGRSVGSRFVEWMHDPLTPSTAPGGTCLRGSAAFERGGDWRSSGVPESDGCGAVMRIAPLAMAFSGEALSAAARVSAVVTHAHPNAIAAAIAGSQLLRTVLEQGLSEEAVHGVIALLHRDIDRSEVVVAALEAGVRLAGQGKGWLDEGAVPEGGGGWRSPSALGLAVAAALRHRDDFARAVELAARIEGDSDSVAALAGMLVGGHLGVRGLPEEWLAVLPERQEIEDLARRLVGRPAVSALGGARTSWNSPIEVKWIEGIADRLGPVCGKIGVTIAPGKKGPSLYGKPWDRDLGMDLDRLRRRHRTELLICLIEKDEMAELGIPDLLEEARSRGIEVLHVPVPDLHAPTVDQAELAAKKAIEAARAGRNVVIHCRGGLGRAGTLAACCCVRLGSDARTAMALVRNARPGAIETAEQEAFLARFAHTAGGTGVLG